jgi:hypothetical protein
MRTMNDDAPLDKLGQAIVPGSYIVYAIQNGYSPDIRVGKVLKLVKRKDFYGRDEWRITVHGVGDDGPHPPLLLSKKSVIGFPERIVVVPEASVPEKHLALLKEAT